MAETTAYLKGGPCDGKTQVVAVKGKPPLFVTCSDGFYNITKPRSYHGGNVVYKYAGKAPVPPPPAKLGAPHALGGWKALRKSVNKGMPHALTYSQKLTRQSLRSLGHSRKVRG